MTDEDLLEPGSLPPWRSIDLYPLRRSPSGRARFLTRLIGGGRASSYGVSYDGREWDPSGMGDLEQIITQNGSLGLDGEVLGFRQIGRLRTKGPLITLRYCWFSAIDTWDNPSLCAVDTYDLSGDTVRVRSRVYNWPDLLPIAKAIAYAQAHDIRAVRGYCASDTVARRMVRHIPPHIFAENLRVSRTGKGRERVRFAEAYRFDLEEHNSRWFVSAFSAE